MPTCAFVPCSKEFSAELKTNSIGRERPAQFKYCHSKCRIRAAAITFQEKKKASTAKKLAQNPGNSCLFCGKFFGKSKHHQKFCNVDCSDEFTKLYRKANRITPMSLKEFAATRLSSLSSASSNSSADKKLIVKCDCLNCIRTGNITVRHTADDKLITSKPKDWMVEFVEGSDDIIVICGKCMKKI
jgi:hypothetical protein